MNDRGFILIHPILSSLQFYDVVVGKIKIELCVCCRALLPVSIPAPISPLWAPLKEYDKSLSMLTPAAMAGAERCEQTLRVKARKQGGGEKNSL